MNDVARAPAVAVAVRINGEASDVGGGTTVADLLVARRLVGKRVAVEVNGEIVPRSRHALTVLAARDRIEIVVAVGGG